jgi:hypothetical protein
MKPSPTLKDRDRGDDPAVGGVARHGRDGGRGQQQDQQRVTELADQDSEHRHAMRSQHVRAQYPAPTGGLVGSEAVLVGADAIEHLSDRLAGSRCEIERRWCGHRRPIDFAHVRQPRLLFSSTPPSSDPRPVGSSRIDS